MFRQTFCLAALAALTSFAAHANDGKTDAVPLLTLQAATYAEVVPDEMVLTLVGTHTHGDLAQANQAALRQAEQLRARLATVEGVRVDSYRIDSFMIEDGKSPRQWRVLNRWVLSSTTPATLAKLATELAAQLQVQGPQWRISPALREGTLAALRRQASQRFLEKASEMAQHLGYAHAQAVELQLHDEEGGPAPIMPMAMARASAELPVEPGQQRLGVTLAGQVRLAR